MAVANNSKTTITLEAVSVADSNNMTTEVNNEVVIVVVEVAEVASEVAAEAIAETATEAIVEAAGAAIAETAMEDIGVAEAAEAMVVGMEAKVVMTRDPIKKDFLWL